jgi:WD repeat-containing protein 45
MNLIQDVNGNTKSVTRNLLSVSFNQDGGCFACGTLNGFRIFNVNPFKETVWRSFQRGGIGIVEMLYRCNLIAVVGGGPTPRYPRNKVFIWDDHQSRNVGELAFDHEVKAVRLRRDKIVVVLKYKTYVYRFNDLVLIDQITTMANSKGLVSVCADPSHGVLAVPGLSKGTIRVELYDLRKATLIHAHETDLACFALNTDGSKICSASEKGTLVRVWDCSTGDPLKELRRGVDRADIFCLTFNSNSTFLACSSDKGTIHIFSLLGGADDDSSGGDTGITGETTEDYLKRKNPIEIQDNFSTVSTNNMDSGTGSGSGHGSESVFSAVEGTRGGEKGRGNNVNTQVEETEEGGDTSNLRSGLAFMRGMLPGLVPKYFGSEWSYAQIRGLEGKCICSFDSDPDKGVLNVVSNDGSFSAYNFREQRGEARKVTTQSFMQNDADESES